MTKDLRAGRFSVIRRSVAVALATLPVIAISWSVVAWWPTLPAELPTQWSGDQVVSWVPTFLFAAIAALIAGGAAAFAWHAGLSPGSYDSPRRVFLISGSVAAMSAAAWLISATVAQSPHHEIGTAGLLAIAALLYGLPPFALVPRKLSATGADEPVVLDVAPSETLAWSRTQTVPYFAWAAVVCGLASVAFGYVPMFLTGTDASNLSTAIVASILAVAFYSGARIRVTVDLRGVRARSTTLGVRIISVRLEDTSSARMVVLEPLRWGGWGYRVGPKGRALVLRGGPAIVVTLDSGAKVAITTPEAEQAVKVLRAPQER